MATKSPTQNFITGNVIEMEAEAEVKAKRLVKLGTAPGQVLETAGVADIVAGVSLNYAAAGARVQIQFGGIAEVECKSAIAYLDQVVPDAGGDGLARSFTSAGATAKSCGQAGGTTTTAEGEIQKVWLRTINVNGPANS